MGGHDARVNYDMLTFAQPHTAAPAARFNYGMPTYPQPQAGPPGMLTYPQPHAAPHTGYGIWTYPQPHAVPHTYPQLLELESGTHTWKIRGTETLDTGSRSMPVPYVSQYDS